MNIPLYIAVMAILVLMSAYFSATETAFSSVSKTRLKLLSETNRKAAIALKLSDNYDKLISTILIGNNIVNIAVASIGTILFVHLLGERIGATVSTVVITVVVLIFSEVCPKGIAKDAPEKFTLFSAPIIRFLIVIFTPISFVLFQIKKLIGKLFKNKDNTAMSQEELLMIVDEAEMEGGIDEDESELLHNAIEFSELSAEDILTHRVDLEAVSVDADKEDIARIFSNTKFSRLLVYEDNIDKIVGVIHQKDFYFETSITDKSVVEIMTPPIFILKNEKIDDLLKKLQKAKSHIAVVLDEYGGTYGIVTMEDILEELVGDIWDEHDEVVEEFTEVSENLFHVDGMMNFEDFCEQFELEAESQSISIGGWAFEQLEKIPEVGDSFEFGKLQVTVTDTDNNRASLLEIKVSEDDDEDEEDEDTDK